MCILQIHALCSRRFAELLSDDVETAELAIEDVMCHVLLALFGEGMVEEVTVRFPSTRRLDPKDDCSIQIRAQIPFQNFALLPRTEEYVKLVLARSIKALLGEL